VSEARRESLRAGAQLALAALLATALLAGTYALTRERIATAEQRAQLQALQLVLPAARHDNNPLQDRVQVQAPAWLGSDLATVYRARLRGQPSALVLETVAPDGYGGPIHLLVAVDAGGRVLGVRVTAHSETPGLGDDIEPDRSDWITRFRGRALGDPPAARWALRRDGGDFDQFAGATVTPRAVVQAVKRCLAFVARHGDAIRAAAPGDTLRFDSAPEAMP
jgi:Na+-translocating ferredoxin:NAD+ oxidoreductase subunit G